MFTPHKQLKRSESQKEDGTSSEVFEKIVFMTQKFGTFKMLLKIAQ